jgi:hypothetical protein
MNPDKILEKIYAFYPPDTELYKDNSFHKSPAGDKLYAAWKLQDEKKTWLPFVDKLNQQTGLDLVSIYRGVEFCFKAYGDFNEFSADKSIDTTLVVSVSTMLPFHAIYVTPVRVLNPIRTFFDDTGNSTDFFDPCYSDECKQIKKFFEKNGEQKCLLQAEATQVLKNVSDIIARNFGTTIMPLDLINKRVEKIAIENSFIGDVNIYTAAFTPHII